MKKIIALSLLCCLMAVLCVSFRSSPTTRYTSHYFNGLRAFEDAGEILLQRIRKSDLQDSADVAAIRVEIAGARRTLKAADFWLRYLEPATYKKLNGPLPVEWETEVFEKFEKPYRREGAGLTLAAGYLDEKDINRDTLARLVQAAMDAMPVYHADSVVKHLDGFHHFYLCNRLYLLNLAAIYTTGFECPDAGAVIPELRDMLQAVRGIYGVYNESYPEQALPADYLRLYDSAIAFAAAQSSDMQRFDHYRFIREYINPLFTRNAELIRGHHVISRSLADFSLNKAATSIFSKALYRGQHAKGIFHRVDDSAVLAEIERLGKLLFYDPILSGNNMRSCASCHKPEQAFTDTLLCSAPQFNRHDFLTRNTPSLLNAGYNHLVMLDGRHLSLQDQSTAVITNPLEMGGDEAEILRRVMRVAGYRKSFQKLLTYTPTEQEVTMQHLVSAITTYYAKFSLYNSPFDEAMNSLNEAPGEVAAGFNLFMGKAQCGTCHFVPQFNGVKPPYVGSEFEVLGVPADTAYSRLSADVGRYAVNPATETMNAFRTGTIRNAARTAPYMHNGVFRTLDEVVEFYNTGGGAGHGLNVPNKTLSADSLHLTVLEKRQLMAFIHSLSERIVSEPAPAALPQARTRTFRNRKVGGEY